MLAKIQSVFRSFLPAKRPAIEIHHLYRIAQEAGVNLDREVCIIGVRGFYNLGQNRRAIYDDAIFVLTPDNEYAFNANTDPGAFRKGIASLKTGTWLYEIGTHGLNKPKKDQYQAYVQAAPVTVIRDETGPDTGKFGINIHKGGWTKVSSLGCQTIYPNQWDEFNKLVRSEMNIRGQETIKYILKDMGK